MGLPELFKTILLECYPPIMWFIPNMFLDLIVLDLKHLEHGPKDYEFFFSNILLENLVLVF